jgi:hypothetical protein
MPRLIREKFEYELPDQPDGANEWVSQKKVRVDKDTPGGNNVFFNTLPPGADIEDAEIADIRKQRPVFVGSNNVDRGLDAAALKRGYSTRPLAATDNNEHQSNFYDEITVDGETGFVERSNVMDRS